jgi:hypothetical protein
MHSIRKGQFLLEQLRSDSAIGKTRNAVWTTEKPLNPLRSLINGHTIPASGILERINDGRAKGESFYSIAAALNREGLSGRYGGRWYGSSVWAYLQRSARYKSF